MRSLTRHLPHYLSLFGILLAGFAGLILFSYDKHFQAYVALGTTIAYVLWGTVHHYVRKDLHFEVFLEYLIVAVLGLTIIFSIILRT